MHWFEHISLVVLENTGWSSVQGLKLFDYFSKNGTVFMDYHGVSHPSGPNYRAWLSGQTWSGNEFDGVRRQSIADQVDYKIIAFRGTPAVRHNPFMDMGNHQDKRTNPTNQGYTDAYIKPFTYLGMDDNNNAHSASLSVADDNVMDAVKHFNGLHIASKLMIVIFDEAFGFEYISNHVFAGMIGTEVAAKQVYAKLSHYNLARYLADNFAATLSPSADPACQIYAGQSLLDLT